jgi:aminoglycoside phosphotransferase (APT) family kinase protein
VRHGYVALPDEKVEREVAAIQLIRKHTDIPVPEIKAWGLSRDNILETGPFIMSSFVEGKDLGNILQDAEYKERSMADSIDGSTIEKIYRQIARFQLQLASLNFSHIGGLSPDAHFDDQRKIINVDKRPLTWKGHSIMADGDVDVLGKCIICSLCK